MEQIDENGFTMLEIIYKADNIEIFKAILNKTQELVAIKKIQISTKEELNEINKEAKILALIRHPNIVNIRMCIFLETENRVEYALIIMDYYSCDDLNREIYKRRNKNQFWSENELLEHMRSLIKTFKYLEENDIVHRDIKPNNIFLTEENKLKVADLGNSRIKSLLNISNSSDLTIAGTSQYLSPILRDAYRSACNGIEDENIQHNPFKSDVYSLGLMFLYMASLQRVVRTTASNNIEENIWLMINQLNYSENLKNILAWMLSYSEEYRPDFIELDRIFSILFPLQVTLQPKKKKIVNNAEHKINNTNFTCIKKGKDSKLEILTSLCSICRKGNITVVSFLCGHKFCRECFSSKINQKPKGICFSCPKEYDIKKLSDVLFRLKWDLNIY